MGILGFFMYRVPAGKRYNLGGGRVASVASGHELFRLGLNSIQGCHSLIVLFMGHSFGGSCGRAMLKPL